MTFVMDASIAGAWLLPDEDAALADVALDRLANETAVVPNLFWHEVRNLLRIAERRKRVTPGYADASMARIRRLPIECPDEMEDGHVLQLARVHALSAYDGSYLALAVHESCPLVTLDSQLRAAARAEGIPQFSDHPGS
ncbi:MAG: type II toxin-antitoxin system VapC family toxin [Rhodospirillales bacterium]|nr:type II toxin-antitoxin system VapC family toxin [Rhodospirillales bacterium]